MQFFIAQEAQPAPEAPADAPGGAGQAPAGPGALFQFLPIVLMILVFWLLILRPQRKQEKERQARVDALRKGDKVRTKGGVIAPVARIKDDEVVLTLAGDGRAEMVVHKAYIEEVFASGGASDAK